MINHVPLFGSASHITVHIHYCLGHSVAGPDDFWPDPDTTFENVLIRILT
jgi:hypothetical protein